MKQYILVVLFSVLYFFGAAQYNFVVEKSFDCTSVKNQQKTGTCWSFATCSFLESELLRKGNGDYDLSEMYVVRNIYRDKATNYVLRQGKANFSQGSLAHDFVNTVARYGIVPEEVYAGREEGEIHNHSEMEAALKGLLDGVLKQKKLSSKWKTAFDAVLTTYIGSAPSEFIFNGKNYSARTFAKSLGLDMKDYVHLTSFTHHPFYNKFILEIPDNFSNGSYFNIPIEELESIVTYAVKNGYTIAWDGDVSEKGFSAREGMAILPEDPTRENLFKSPGPEIKVTQQNRQEEFESYTTTDDHLMHITGTAKDKKGNLYLQVKNSWGPISEFQGFLYMSIPYFRMKTVAITVHKDAIPKDIAQKMFY